MAKGRVRRQPQRTCIACRGVSSKRGLVRLVRTPEGEVVLDPTGKRAGRGAYLCRREACWQLARERGAVQRALGVTPSEAELQALDAYFAALAAEPEDEGKTE